jgi:soluble lytic murein transglycosylase-like protein
VGQRGVRSRFGNLRRISFAVGLLILSAAAARAELYYFIDGQGAYHFTTNRSAPGAQPYVFSEPLADLSAPEPRRFAPRTPGAGPYDDLIADYAQRYGVDPALIRAVIRAESGFNRVAVSPKGARGLMQLMPATARSHGCRDPYDADDNIHAGVEHLRALLDEHPDSLPRALAAYNAGSEPVTRHRGIPPYAETQQYVRRVLELRREYLRQQRLASIHRRASARQRARPTIASAD